MGHDIDMFTHQKDNRYLIVAFFFFIPLRVISARIRVGANERSLREWVTKTDFVFKLLLGRAIPLLAYEQFRRDPQ